MAMDDPLAVSDTELPEPAISVQVDERYAQEVDAADLERTIGLALQAEGHPEGELTLVVTGDEEVHALNLQFLGEDHPTDVLSFPSAEESTEAGRPVFVIAPAAEPEAAPYLGDILIALPFTRRQAAELGRELKAELRLLAVHGTLHLLGYDHAEPEEEAIMWARQDAILAQTVD
jgi:probable rRNA maturation factor